VKISLRRILLAIPLLLALGVACAVQDTVQSVSVAKQPVPALSLAGLDGATHTLEEWRGKVIVLNFWASWCSPCLHEIRDFVGYHAKYKARGLQIIGVGLDDERKLRNVQRTLEINYPVLIADPATDLLQRWGNRSGVVPYTVVIDREGRVKFSQRGLVSREDFEEYILPLLNKV
jgi:peroxiredoxin